MNTSELIERLDIETDGLGTWLKNKMKDDPSPIESISADYELIEGGDEITHEGEIWAIKSFIVWTQDHIYHSAPEEDAFLYESGAVFKVKRNPVKQTNKEHPDEGTHIQ